jgi:hypothetical protein
MTVDSINMPLNITMDSGSVDTTDPLLIADFDNIIDWCVYFAQVDHGVYTVYLTETAASSSPPFMVTNMDPDNEVLYPYFGWLPFDMVKETFAHTPACP